MSELVTTKKLAAILGITPRRIQQLSGPPDNVFRKISRGKFDLSDSIQKYISYQIELERRKYKKNDMDINEARRRKEIAEAELKEIELERQKGDLLPKNEVILTWQKILSVLRSRLLAMPAKLAPILMGLSTISEIKNELNIEIRNMLEELSNAKNFE